MTEPKTPSKPRVPTQLPLLPVRDVVVFPHMVLPLSVGRERSIKALEAATAGNRLIFVAAQRRAQVEDPTREDLYEVGTVGEVVQMLKLPDGTVKIILQGTTRARVLDFHLTEGKYAQVDIQLFEEEPANAKPEMQALIRQCVDLFDQYVKLQRRVSLETLPSLTHVDDPSRLADTVASHLLVKLADKQEILELPLVSKRLERLCEILHSEIEILNLEKRIHNRVRTQIEKSQKEYYLTEQMKAIQKELRSKDDFSKELDELRAKAKAAQMTKEASEVAEKEITRLEKMMPLSPEATVSRNYLDWLINLPWSKYTEDTLDLKHAQKILNEDHFGLDKPKERVVEYLAVLKLVKKIKGPIICFVGPPGVGKTSFGRSIARALNREFVRVSLGGVRDESEIRGHRRTYIGSLPGRIIQSMRKAKSHNPVFLLDEIDKMGSDWRGDPAAALLEVLDPEQNHNFVDHYLDVGFDLSRVMFITTANTLYTIPLSLQDRLEIIRFPGYTMEEKLYIAQKFLLPKQMKEHGLAAKKLIVSPEAFKVLIKEYTQEAGVRSLEREVATLCRKAARRLVEEKTPIKIDSKDLKKYLGIPKFFKEKRSPNAVGVATGLAWTENGGETLSVEVTVMPGRGNLILTGKLGDVMQESAKAAISYVRSLSLDMKMGKDSKLRNHDLHIHVPEGAIPKDGPSAGIALATAVASALTGRAVRSNVAMTGEITLRGRVLPIGGLKEKVLAAYREGVETILYPRGNEKDLEEIPLDVQKGLKLVPVSTMDDVLRHALETRRSPLAGK